MQSRGCKRVVRKLVGISARALMLCSVAFAQIPTAQPPNTNINPPQRQKAPAGPQQRLPGGTPPQTVMRPPANGAIAGYVYWDTNFVAHTPADNCIGLGAVVSVGTPTQGSPTFQQFKTLGLYQNFTYLGNVGSLAVCQYSIPQVPTGVDLRVWIYFKLVFTPQVLASVPTTANNPSGTIKISGGTCNQVPPAVPNASVLGSGWWTCGNNAYNVNFVLQPATPGNMVSGSGQFTVQSATPPGSANGGQNPTNPGMLSGSNQSRGMLAPGATQSAQPGTPATLLGNRQPPASQSGFQNPGSKVELNSQPLPPGQASNMGVLQSTPSGPAGNVEGYVLWDTSLIQYKLSTPCQGLQVIIVDMGNNSQPTLASTNNLTPLWSAPQLNSAISNQNYSGPTSKGPWMVCHYSFGQLPEREALEVRANVTQSSAFSPPVTPAKVTGSTGTQFTIPPGNCNTRRARSTLSTILGSFIDFCGGHAFNVNVELFPAGMGSRGPLPPNTVVRNVVSAGGGGAMLTSSLTQRGMLSGAQQSQSPGLPVVQSAQVAPSIGQLHSSLCSIANCTLGLPVIKSLNTASVVSPGGKVVIQGANFNSADGDPGQIVLKIGTKFPMPIVKLGVPTQPVFHQPYVERQLTVLGWADSHVFGQIPADISGVMDGPVTLEVWRSDGWKSAPFTVNFTAARDLQILPMSDVTLKSCTNTADGNRCDQSTDSSQLTIPSHMGFDPSFSIFGEHTTFIQNTQQQASGSDKYSFDLKNGWVLDESYQFENGITENQACKGDFADEKFDNSKPPSKIRTSDVRIPWYVSCDLQYAVALHITGPKGVPWK